MSAFLDATLTIRLRASDKAELEEIYQKDHDKYDNAAHVARCLIVQGLRGGKG